MKVRKILILGAGGFIGSCLVNKIILNEMQNDLTVQVAGFNVDKFFGVSNIMVFDGEITEELLGRCVYPDVIYHLAGGSSVAASVSEPGQDYNLTLPNINVLLNKMRVDWPKSKLIYISSAAVYGANASDNTSVNISLAPISPYGLHKQIAEQIIEFYSRMYNLTSIIVRPFSVYGEGLKKQLFWDVLNKAKGGEFSYFGSGEEKRDWIYVGDLSDFLLELRNREFEHFPQVINAGRGQAMTIKESVTKILSIAGYTQKPQFSSTEKPGDPDNLVASAQEQLEYQHFFKMNFDDGINKYVEWYSGINK